MSETRKVKIRRRVEQVRHDWEYGGIVVFDGTELKWNFTFTEIPISRISDKAPSDPTFEDVQRLYRVTITGMDGEPAALTNDEYGFFLKLLLEPVIAYFNNPQAQAANSPETQELQRAASLYGASVGHAFESTVTAEFNTAICDMLSQEKFGCTFADPVSA